MSWLDQAREFLQTSRDSSGGWGYRAGGQVGAEPTAMAVLALHALGQDATQGAAWLAETQRPDGAVVIQRGRSEPTWPTPHAMLAWLAQGGHDPAVSRAADYLIGRGGKHWDPKQSPQLGHDTSIPGWPWVEGTHSWVEPTSFAVCALRLAGKGAQRVERGRALLVDRVTASGGWNYGNTRVLSAELDGFPAPTGLALLATLPELAGDERIARSVEALAQQVTQIRSPGSLSWAVLGLQAAGRAPAEAPTWLQASFERMTRRGLRTVDVSLLVLAANAQGAVRLFGAGEVR